MTNKNSSRRDMIKYLAVAIAFPEIIFAQSQKQNHSLENYVDALITIESSGNPKAERYEPRLEDWSYGLGQLLTKTAKELEKKHLELPRLGETKEEIKANLFNPEINRKYATALFQEELDFYKDPILAVAAYNSGHLTPRNARCQEQLNELYKTNLITDGIIGNKSGEVVKRFQRDYSLDIDGIIGEKTYTKLQQVWKEKFPNRENSKGIIPINKYTPNHVRKFREALNFK